MSSQINRQTRRWPQQINVLGFIRYGCKADYGASDDRTFARFWDDIGEKLD